jgi:diacylglycerol kinase (ATP)
MNSAFDIRTVSSTFIFNPRSGHNARNPYLLERTQAFIAEHRLPAEIQLTAHPRHATQLAADALARGHGAVVSIGGDGTLNEIAQALIDTPCVLGLIPCGSGNGLGRHLGIPGPSQTAFDTLLAGRLRAIDCGLIAGHPFFNVAGLGFDAEISARFNQLPRRGLLAYVQTTLRMWQSYRPAPYTVHTVNGPITTPAFLIAVANSDQYGNNCFIAPGARVDDGRLNLTILTGVHWRNALPLAYRLFRGSIHRSRTVV